MNIDTFQLEYIGLVQLAMKLREFGEYKEFDNEKIDGFKKYIEEAWNKRYYL